MESMEKKVKQTPAPPSPAADPDGSGGDRISALDDDLCGLILRLADLNVRELARTSVLSTRWRGLWKRAPALDFSGWPQFESADDVGQYIAIVNDILEQRARATSEARIEEVSIPLLLRTRSLFGQREQEQLLTPAMEAAGAWIRYAMHHQVKAFEFKLELYPLDKMPVMDLDELLPSSPKLEYMSLGLSTAEVRLPRTVVFTSLRDLTLAYIILAAGSGHLLARLLSPVCCPSLQKLRMIRVWFENFGTNELVLDTGELLELSMEMVFDMELLELRTPKLLSLEIIDCWELDSLRVSAPALKKLIYSPKRGLVHGPLPCVRRLHIDLRTHKREDHDEEEDPNSSSISLLKHCSSSVRCLLADLYVPLVQERYVDLIKDNIPQLPNVTSLLVNICKECQRHSFGDGVASLLTKFKNLEYLRLKVDGSTSMTFKADEFQFPSEDDPFSLDDAFSFTCNHPDHWESSNISLANLREADFRGMTGTGCELRFLRLVLANTTVLQSVTVSFNLYFIKRVQDSRMHYFLHTLLGDGTWTACENEDQDFDNNYLPCSNKLYKWTPSP